MGGLSVGLFRFELCPTLLSCADAIMELEYSTVETLNGSSGFVSIVFIGCSVDVLPRVKYLWITMYSSCVPSLDSRYLSEPSLPCEGCYPLLLLSSDLIASIGRLSWFRTKSRPERAALANWLLAMSFEQMF